MIRIISEDFNLRKIADSGQCFRMTEASSDSLSEKWQLIAMDRLAMAEVNLEKDETVIECPEEDNDFWHEYFDLDTDYEKYRLSVDSNDSFLNAATDFGKGIRILKQDPWEMVVTFIISQRKSIPAIKTCIEKICERWGKKIGDNVYAFPDADELSRASLDELKETGLGYRAEYIYLVSRQVSSGKLALDELKTLGDEDLLKALMEIRGIGPKVANCVSLFGYYRVAAFPVDVWIDRVQKQFYSGAFPVASYEGYAGIMQQYIFYYARYNMK